MSRGIAKEIKEEILSKVQAGERVADPAEQYGVSAESIYDWLRQANGETVILVLEYNKLKRENEELKRLIGELTLNMHQQKSRDGPPKQAEVSLCQSILGVRLLAGLL